jgi:riboflavin synthase
LEGLQLGDSVAVNGVCLTVRRQSSGGFQAELSEETLNRSSLGDLKKGSLVNLERPLLATSRLGGHFVQGHVDAVGKVLAIRVDGDFAVWKFLPDFIERYVVEKDPSHRRHQSYGGIAYKGAFEVALIPIRWRIPICAAEIGDSEPRCDVLAVRRVDAEAAGEQAQRIA